MAGPRTKRKRVDNNDNPSSSSAPTAAPSRGRRRGGGETAEPGGSKTENPTMRKKSNSEKKNEATTSTTNSKNSDNKSNDALQELPIPKKKSFQALKTQQQQVSPATGASSSKEGNDHAESPMKDSRSEPKTSLVEQNNKQQISNIMEATIPKKVGRPPKKPKSSNAPGQQSTNSSRTTTPTLAANTAPASATERPVTANDNTKKQHEKGANPGQPPTQQSTASSSSLSSNRPLSPADATRIRDLLEHRKILLHRVQQGRTAAQKRLDELYEQQPSKKAETDTQEINAFKEMVKTATSVARKHARNESMVVDSEKRSSVSLRRGASVGKRMNAALHSLAPGMASAAHAWAASATMGANALPTSPVPGATASATTAAVLPADMKTKTQQRPHLPKRPNSTSALPTSSSMFAPTKAGAFAQKQAQALKQKQKQASVLPDSKVASAAAAAAVAASTAAAAAARASTTKKGGSNALPKQPSDLATASQKSLKKAASSRIITVSGTAAAAAAAAAAAVAKSNSTGMFNAQLGRLGAHNASAGHMPLSNYRMQPPSQLQIQQPTPVSYPEAEALRERKKDIERKLTALLQARQQKIQGGGGGNSQLHQHVSPPSTSPSPRRDFLSQMGVKGSAFVSRQKSYKADIPPKVMDAALKGPGDPSSLPRRRKTQWDYLLEEMKWMATDFTEERKWKRCTNRMLGESVKSQQHVKITSLGDTSDTSKGTVNDDGSEKGVPGAPIGVDDAGAVATEINKYVEACGDDIARARVVAGLMSSMVLELSTAIENSGVMSSGEADELSIALQRHQLTRKRLVGNELFRSDNGLYENESMDALNKKKKEGSVLDRLSDIELTGSDGNLPLNGSEKDKIFCKISDYVDEVLEKVKKSNWQSDCKKLPGLESLATAGQIGAIVRIEDLWNRVESGTVLGGMLATGKTVVSCALVWKNRKDGPQLIICNRLNMIRWMHELGRFEGLNLRPIACSTGISAPAPAISNSTEYEASDVVLCDFAAVSKLSRKTVSKFCCIVLDSRFPRAYFGSREPVSGEHENVMARNFATKEMPPQLTCSKWWSQLAIATAESQHKRLLIDSSPMRDTLPFLAGVPDRQLLEVLGLRLAFLLGVKNFVFPDFSLAKGLLAWARKRIKKSDSIGTKFQRVRELFISLVDQFYCEIEGGKRLEDLSLQSSNSISWNLRMCDMTDLQRVAYDKACIEARAALSVTLTSPRAKQIGENDPFASVSDVLLRFRRLCIHSSCTAVLCKAFERAAGKIAHARCSQKNLGGGSAQPDAEMAACILQGSGKMRELLSILFHECGIEIANFDSLAQFFSKTSWKSSAKKMNKESTGPIKRVAVLASLPEAQLLSSLLLNSVGIDHDVLLKPFSPDASFSTGGAIHVQPMAWVNCQLLLSRFNDETKGTLDSEYGLKRVVIGSFETVAGDNSGLGVEAADVVISFDEDWSGRSELQIMSLGARCLSRSNSLKKEAACKFIKLAAARSCEQNFVSREDLQIRRKNESLPWPLEATGSFSVPDKTMSSDRQVINSWTAKEPAPGTFAFPACNILVWRNKGLTEVLSPTKPLQALLFSQSDMLFLPQSDEGSENIDIEMNLVSRLINREVLSTNEITWQTNNETDCFRSSTTSSEPLPSAFPENFVGRLDLTVLPSRFYLQQLLKDRSCWKPSISADAAASLPPELLMISELQSDSLDETEQIAAGFTGKKDELAASLLFYGLDQPATDEVNEKQLSARRANSYSSIFSQSNCAPVFNDGNSGAEPLVYFPPLFPRMLECSALARRGVETLRSRVVGDGDQRKRSSDGFLLSNTKRPKIDADKNEDVLIDSSEPHNEAATEPCLITEDEASHNDAASVLFDLSDDFGLAGIGAVPLPRDSALTAANSSVQSGYTALSVGDAGSWFSNGRFPSDAEDIQDSAIHGSFTFHLDSMILFVSRKRSWGTAGHLGQPSYSLSPQLFPAWTGGGGPGTLTGSFSDLYTDLNGAGNKAKKKTPNQGFSAFSRLPVSNQRASGQLPVGAQFGKRKRASLLSRYTGSANTLFETPLFRAASLRVRTNVAERFERHGWTSGTAFEAGPGLPLLVSKQPAAFPPYQGFLQVDPNLWTSLVKRLKTKGSLTGDEAIELSTAQQMALRRSLVAPCRVDFGPFQIGFLASPSGTTAVPPPRARAGISLPLGVKLPPFKDTIQPHWSSKDDRRLQRSVERFGMNWVLVASVMGGFQDIVYSSPRDRPNNDISRSARSCREHWMGLVRSQPSLIPEMKRHEPIFIKRNDPMDTDEVPKDPAGGKARPSVDNVSGMITLIIGEDREIEFLVQSLDGLNEDTDIVKVSEDPSLQSKSDTTMATVDEPVIKEPSSLVPAASKARRAFSAIRSARAKTQVVPMTIPGVGSGSPPAVVPSHPSHMQSVQSSVAAAWTNGRTEMWPLQLLEAGDSHRTTIAAAAVASSTTRLPPGQSRAPSSNYPPGSASASVAVNRSSSRGGSAAFPAAPPNSSVVNVASSRASAGVAAPHNRIGRNSSTSPGAPPTHQPPPARSTPAIAQNPPSQPPPSTSKPSTSQPPTSNSKT